VWEDGELAGVRLRVATERARAAAGAAIGGADAPAPEHELTLHLHRRARHGPRPSTGPDATEPSGVPGAADRLVLLTATRLLPQDVLRDDAPDAGAPAAAAAGALAGPA
jgi:hypothetical protein